MRGWCWSGRRRRGRGMGSSRRCGLQFQEPAAPPTPLDGALLGVPLHALPRHLLERRKLHLAPAGGGRGARSGGQGCEEWGAGRQEADRQPSTAPARPHAAPELRAALIHKGAAVPSLAEARHVGGIAEAQVRARQHLLLGAAQRSGGRAVLMSRRGRGSDQTSAGAAAAGGGGGGAPGLARHVAEPVGPLDPFAQRAPEGILLRRQGRQGSQDGARAGRAPRGSQAAPQAGFRAPNVGSSTHLQRRRQTPHHHLQALQLVGCGGPPGAVTATNAGTAECCRSGLCRQCTTTIWCAAARWGGGQRR